MAEQQMRQRVIKALKPLDAVSVENKCGKGTPDVNYIEGWLELKWLRAWPKRPSTVVKLDHELTKEQRVWLSRRNRRDGIAWVLLQCGREWLLLNGAVAAEHLCYVTRSELIEKCHCYWSSGLKDDELVKALREANA